MQDAFLASVLRQDYLGSRDPDMALIYCRAIPPDQLLLATSKLGCNALGRRPGIRTPTNGFGDRHATVTPVAYIVPTHRP